MIETQLTGAKIGPVDVLAAVAFQTGGDNACRLAGADRLPSCFVKTVAHAGFFGNPDSQLLFCGRAKGEPRDMIVVGVGPAQELTGERLRRAAGLAVRAALRQAGAKKFAIVLGEELLALRLADGADALGAWLEGTQLAAYRYLVRQTVEDRTLTRARVHLARPTKTQKATAATVAGTMAGVALALDLANAPGNVCTPQYLAAAAARLGTPSGTGTGSKGGGKKRGKKAGGSGGKLAKAAAMVGEDPTVKLAQGPGIGMPFGAKDAVALDVQLIEKKQLKKQGFGGILAVNAGSDNPPVLVQMRYTAPGSVSGGKRKTPTVCFVGKGITFDTGGYAIKSAEGQHGMKYDMAGGAAVIGLMQAIAYLQPAVNVVGLVPATDNMIDGKAYKIDDVLTMYSGKTVEVLNTDAEGRLVLADALAYACDKIKPDVLIDYATLTGAAVVALGEGVCAALMTTDEALGRQIAMAGTRTHERVWPLPLWPEYDRMVKSRIADLKNVGKGRWGGSITAGAFLKAFVTRAATRWAHLDIAPTAKSGSGSSYLAAGATAFGVRLGLAILDEIAATPPSA